MPESTSRKHGEGTYQMLWDCKFCGTQKLLGLTHRHCPSCGAAQDPAWRYFPAEADMVAVEDHKFVGADKVCPACSQPNSAASTFCVQCGADLATGKVAAVQATRELGTGGAQGDTRRDVVKAEFDAEMQRVGAAGRRSKGRGRSRTFWLLVGIGVLALVALIAGAIYALTYEKETGGTVSALTWERTVTIQTFGPVSDAAWDDQVPNGAYQLSCERRERDTRRVESGSHEECRDVDQGDGSLRRDCRTVTDYRDEPVYDQWCRYQVDRWTNSREVAAQGDAASAPAWPLYSLALGSGGQGYGKERAGDQDEVYVVVIREKGGGEHRCEYDSQAGWARFQVGAAVTMKLNIAGQIDCDSLKIAP